MKRFDAYPKSFKKTVRFIRQEATIEQIRGMERLFVDTVALRLGRHDAVRGEARKRIDKENRQPL